ncbi:MerR family transcriptional regulator [Pseudomonadota bacterium]
MILKNSYLLDKYSLKEIAAICGIDNIRTARYYLSQILPESHRGGRGKNVKYTRDTLHCFLLLTRLKDETPLRLDQISGVLKSLNQAQINRIVNGEEPLEIGLAVKDQGGRYRLPEDYVRKGHSSALLVDGDDVQVVRSEEPGIYLTSEHPKPSEQEWNEFPVSSRVQLRYKGALSDAQLEELEIVSRIINSIIDDDQQQED